MKLKLTMLTLSLAILSSSAIAEGKSQWGYQGNEGPEFWGKLSPDFTTCSSGVNQSPVNITGTINAELKLLDLDYKQPASDILNNGHTVQLNSTQLNSTQLNSTQLNSTQLQRR